MKGQRVTLGIYFSDIFNVDPAVLEDYGAFNISLVNDLPLFVDPFLLFQSDDPEHRAQHDSMLTYLRFLREVSGRGDISDGLLRAWFVFPEVKQNWLGYSKVGNGGTGLGIDFARALHANLAAVFSNFGAEEITRSSHLEKLCLIHDGVGRDNISDFVTNLTKEYLLRFTEEFAHTSLRPEQCRKVPIQRVAFDYETRTWVPRSFYLPYHNGDFVLLTPHLFLTRDDTWINRPDLHRQFEDVVEAIPNDQLRAELNQYLLRQLPKKATDEDVREARALTIRTYPQIIDYFIRLKEDTGDEARRISDEQVEAVERVFIDQVSELVRKLKEGTLFYDVFPTTHDEARKRVLFLKDVIENKGGHRLFYADGKPIRRESDLHVMYRLTWYATPSDITGEANDGRGPVDFKVSRGARDKSLVEFKLASNTALRRNLEKQVEIYKKASDAKRALKVIIYFNEQEYAKIQGILRELEIEKSPDVVLIDARDDNKPSGSKA